MPGRRVLVGCAGWVIPRAWAARFPGPGTHLERYGRVLPAVEIDTSFYRSHARETYARWSHAVPPAFRFAVKAPRLVTHTRRLRRATEPFRRFLGEARGLGNKLGAVLIQLPPSLRYQGRTVAAFLGSVRRVWRGGVALEPRHGSWFDGTGDRLLAGFRVARVAA
ncbi:MAG TPA: DUF72 domain-containing protein, partial [Gemmatimonadales bacterium]|nr:DUF72 domain-containing protein [Gemmatimonadales bacterium]